MFRFHLNFRGSISTSLPHPSHGDLPQVPRRLNCSGMGLALLKEPAARPSTQHHVEVAKLVVSLFHFFVFCLFLDFLFFWLVGYVGFFCWSLSFFVGLIVCCLSFDCWFVWFFLSLFACLLVRLFPVQGEILCTSLYLLQGTTFEMLLMCVLAMFHFWMDCPNYWGHSPRYQDVYRGFLTRSATFQNLYDIPLHQPVYKDPYNGLCSPKIAGSYFPLYTAANKCLDHCSVTVVVVVINFRYFR